MHILDGGFEQGVLVPVLVGDDRVPLVIILGVDDDPVLPTLAGKNEECLFENLKKQSLE